MTIPTAKPIKAIILSAGQGRRLLPLTENTPKCLLPVADRPVLAWQIDALLAAGIDNITVITGFQVGLIEELLQQQYAEYPGIKILFNPFYEVADNLASCWIARGEMGSDFLILNGDTVIEPALLSKVLEFAPGADYTQRGFQDQLRRRRYESTTGYRWLGATSQ
jgi:choline kinase